MSILAWIEDQKRLKLLNAPQYVNPASGSRKGLWTRCDKCGVILYIKHLKENQRVCFGCSYHLQMSSPERVENLLDQDSWRPFDETVSPCDPLEFYDNREYTDRLEDAQEATGLQDAIQTGTGMVDGIPVALGVMDFAFMGGSMGSVVGEKVTRLIEYATQEGLTLILVSASGGARMQEGVFSLMQMAKISGALQVYQSCANLLYISILTSPTTGGVTASFAMLGDIIFAEPKALIAFAGRRVIEQTLCEDLPDDFQTAEYMLHHGLLDLIVPRRFLRQALSESIRLYKNAPFKKAGRIPFGVQNPITFLTEEKIRRRWVTVTDFSTQDGAKPYSVIPGNKNLQSSISTGIENSSFLSSILENESNTVKHTLSPSNTSSDSGYKDANPSEKNVQNGLSREVSMGEQSSYSGGAKLPPEYPIQSFQDSSNFYQTENLERNDNDLPKATPPQDASLPTLGKVAPQEDRNTIFGSLPEKEEVSFRYQPKRESMEYRDILTSFQSMFHLFSKEMVLPYSFDTNTTELSLQKTDLQNSNNDDFFHQAISVAATESVQWRAFYVHQKISKKTGFLEDFYNSQNIKEEEILSESNLNSALQNTLFYKSICTTKVTID